MMRIKIRCPHTGRSYEAVQVVILVRVPGKANAAELQEDLEAGVVIDIPLQLIQWWNPAVEYVEGQDPANDVYEFVVSSDELKCFNLPDVQESDEV